MPVSSVGQGNNHNTSGVANRRHSNSTSASDVNALDAQLASGGANAPQATGPTDTEDFSPEAIIQDIGGKLIYNAITRRKHFKRLEYVISEEELQQFYKALEKVTGKHITKERKHAIQSFLQSIANGSNVDPKPDGQFTTDDLVKVWSDPKTFFRALHEEQKIKHRIERDIKNIVNSIIKNKGDFSKVDPKLFKKLADELAKLTGISDQDGSSLRAVQDFFAHVVHPFNGLPQENESLNIEGLRSIKLEDVVREWLNPSVLTL